MEFIIEKSGERLDKYLVSKMPGVSRTKLQNAIKLGAVLINGKRAEKPSAKLRAGDKLILHEEKIVMSAKNHEIKPEKDIPLDIIYEDADILVINKPAGLLAHPTSIQMENTLVNALVARYPDIANVGENPMRPGIVHRLDKDTSGLMIVAKNQKAFEYIKEQFLNRTVTKKYLALVWGVPEKNEGVIEYEIRASKTNRLKRVAVKKPADIKNMPSRAATTLYKVIKIIDDKFALIEAQPLTGRTHQIRVHLAAIGHPIVGDVLYGAKKESVRGLGMKRQFLHAFYLKFMAPSGKEMEFELELPEELKQLIAYRDAGFDA